MKEAFHKKIARTFNIAQLRYEFDGHPQPYRQANSKLSQVQVINPFDCFYVIKAPRMRYISQRWN